MNGVQLDKMRDAEVAKQNWLLEMTNWELVGSCYFGKFPDEQQGPFIVLTHDFIVFTVVCYLFDQTDWDNDVVTSGLAWWQVRDWLAGRGNR